jgi:hypothetical protein
MVHGSWRFVRGQLHEIKWNANNANGNPVPPGVYFLRIETGDFKETKKILVTM